VWSSSTRSVPIGPFGETFTCPAPSSGAVATKNMCCLAIHSRSGVSIASKTFAIDRA
jgi:hypothetical protein